MRYKEFKRLSESAMQDNEILDEAAWTKKAGKNKEGGLNEKGRKSYERANPGSDLCLLYTSPSPRDQA